MTTKILGKLSQSIYRPLPYFIERVPAGFPSPASGYIEASIDLNELCISHPSATFLDMLNLMHIGIMKVLAKGVGYSV